MFFQNCERNVISIYPELCSSNFTCAWSSFCSQVVPKSFTSGAQVVTNSQTPQRLIMPATHLPQIQPSITNLPPGTVLTPAHGSGNMGYAVLPAPYVTQVCMSVMEQDVWVWLDVFVVLSHLACSHRSLSLRLWLWPAAPPSQQPPLYRLKPGFHLTGESTRAPRATLLHTCMKWCADRVGWVM